MEKSVTTDISTPWDVCYLVLSALAILLNAYAFVLVWWSPDWPQVFAVAFAASTLLEFLTPWDYHQTQSAASRRANVENSIASACVTVVVYTGPALVVALLKPRVVAVVVLPVWIAMAARRIFQGHNRHIPLLGPVKLLLEIN